MAKELKHRQCVRLFDKDGKHTLSILRCYDDERDYDITLPNGEVLWCGPMNSTVETIIENMPIENIPKNS
jgi:hypothetical protein